MSKKASPTAIGVFVFLGLVLGIFSLLLFTSSRLFKKTTKFLTYFESSLNGLNEGAPVKFRGVRIGTVYRLMIRFNQATNDSAMPVIIELQDELIRRRMEGVTSYKGLGKLSEGVRAGLRAKLETESLLTGLLYVDLEIDPSAPAVFHQLEPKFVEIPSVPTDIQAFLKNIEKLDLRHLQDQLSGLVTRVDTILERMKLEELSHNLNGLVTSANRVVSEPELTNAIAGLNDTLGEYKHLGVRLNARVDPLVNSVTNTLGQLDGALAEIRGGMVNFRDTLAADSPLRNELNSTLVRLGEASESVSALADFLEKHPNSLITGRKPASAEKKP